MPSGSFHVLLRRIAVYASGNLVPAVLTLLTSMIFTRIFAPETFGAYSLALVIATPIRLLFTTWLTLSIARFLPAEQTPSGVQKTKQAIFLSTLFIFVLEGALGLLTIAIAQAILPLESRAFLAPVLCFTIVTSVFEILGISFAAESRAGTYVSYRAIDSVVTLLLRLAFVSNLFHMGIRLMFWSVVISNGVLLPLMWARAGLPRLGMALQVFRSAEAKTTANAFLVFGLPMTLWYLSGVLLDVGDRYVLSFLLGPGPVGIYDASYRMISGLAALMVVPLAHTLHPYLMNISTSEDKHKVGPVLATIIENLLLVGGLAVGVTALLHKDLARVLLGPQFREGSVVMPAVVAGVFFLNVGSFAHKPFEIIGRTRPMVVLGLAAAAVNIGLCFALIPAVGYSGAAYATFLSYFLYAVVVGAAGRRVIPWKLDLRRLAAPGGLLLGGILSLQLLRSLITNYSYFYGLTAAVLGSSALTAVLAFRLVRQHLIDRPERQVDIA